MTTSRGRARKTSFEMPGNGHRPLDQRRHFVEQRVFDQGLAAGFRGGRHDTGADQVAALAEIRDYLGAAQLTFVGRRRRQSERPRCMEPMPRGDPARCQSEHFDRHHLGAEQQDDAAYRPHEFRRARPPAHALGDGQRRDRLIDDVCRGARWWPPPTPCPEMPATLPCPWSTARGRPQAPRSSSRRRWPLEWGAPLASKELATGGPRRSIRRSGADSAQAWTRTAKRRGVAKARALPCAMPAPSKPLRMPSSRATDSVSSVRGGNSSGAQFEQEIAGGHRSTLCAAAAFAG